MFKLVTYGREHPNDPAFRLVEFAAPDGCALDDRKAWKKANPALGDFLAVDALAATLKTTREGPWRRYRLGQWVGSTSSWLPFGAWESRARPERVVGPGERVVLFFDGSVSGDTTALIGCTLDGFVFVVEVWQHPGDGDDGWRVPRHEVDATMRDAFDRWDVVEAAADPWGWRFGDRGVGGGLAGPGHRVADQRPVADRPGVQPGVSGRHGGDPHALRRSPVARHVANCTREDNAVRRLDHQGEPDAEDRRRRVHRWALKKFQGSASRLTQRPL